MLTPRYYAFTVNAGIYHDVNAYGRYISIITVSASTVALSIDDEAPQQIVSGTQIDCEDRHYSKLRFLNTGGVAANVILLLTDLKVSDMRGNALFAAMVASLAAIDVDTTNINAGVGVSNGHLNTISGNIADIETLITAGNVDLAALEVLATAGNVNTGAIVDELQGLLAPTGWGTYATLLATAGQVMAAAATRRMCSFQADDANADYVYIGYDNTVTNLKWALKLVHGQGYTIEVGRYPIWAYSPTINQYLGWTDA
jgi:hypothetical protein